MSPMMAGFLVFFGGLATFRVAWMGRRVVAVRATSSVFTPVASETPVTGALGRLATPSDPVEVDLQRRDLARAGFRRPRALTYYLATRTALSLALPAIGLLLVPGTSIATGFLLLLSLAAIGYYVPWGMAYLLRGARQAQIRRVLPDALDMLVSCLESGLGLDAALRYVSRELGLVAPELAGELDIVNAELQAGIPRAEALAGLDARIGVEDVAALVSVLGQAERYGAGIADSVRAHAQMSRRRRVLDAERRAAEAAPKLTVVMILFVLPPLFVVLIGPTVVHVMTRLIPMLEGR